MTRLISILIVLIVIYGGYQFFRYWEKISAEKETQQKEAAAARVVPEQLPGMPAQMEVSLRQAQNAGAAGLREWLKRYRPYVRDPRLAWIELDYVVLVAKDDSAEARKVFAAVKSRTPGNSPVYPRIKQLEKTYE